MPSGSARELIKPLPERPVPLDEFFHAFYLAWARAVATFAKQTCAKRSAEDMLSGERDRVQALCKSTPKVTSFTTVEPFGYDPRECALWIETNRAGKLVPPANRFFFRPDRPLEERLRSFFDDSSDGQVAIDPLDMAFIKNQWGSSAALNLGRVLFGQHKGRGMVIITFRELPYRTAEEVYTLVVSEREAPRFREFNPPSISAWWRDTRGDKVPRLPTNDDKQFELLCHDVSREFAARFDLDRIITIHVRSNDSDGREAAAREILRVEHSIASDVTLIVCANYAFEEDQRDEQIGAVRDGIMSAQIERRLPSFEAVILDTSDVARIVLANPWLWSKHVNVAGNVEIVAPGDWQRVERLLLPSWTTDTHEEFLHESYEIALRVASDLQRRVRAIDAPPSQWFADVIEPVIGEVMCEAFMDLDRWAQQRVVHEWPALNRLMDDLQSAAASLRDGGEAALMRFADRFHAELVDAYLRLLFPVDLDVAFSYFSFEATADALAVEGDHGSGRTVLLYQILREYAAERVIAILGGRASPERTILAAGEDMAVLEAMMRDPALASHRWTVVVERLELEAGLAPGATTLARLLDVARRMNEQTPGKVRLLATFPADGDEAFARTYTVLRTTMRVVRPEQTADFLRNLFTTWAQVYGNTISDALLEELVTHARAAGLPLAEVVRRLRFVRKKQITESIVNGRFMARTDGS